MKITVTPLSLEDREQWEKLYQGYAEFYQVPMDKNILETVWSWVFDESHKFYGIIAKDEEGAALGMMHFREMPSPLRGKYVGFLDDLYVHLEYRGRGVVEALFETLDKSAKSQDWPAIRWITAENNYRGRSVYDKIAKKTHWLTYQMTVKE